MNKRSILKKSLMDCIALWIGAFMFFPVIGCTARVESYMKDKLGNPDYMNITYNAHPINIANASKCKSPPTVKIINDEIRNEDLEVLNDISTRYVVNPKEALDLVAAYLKHGFEQSNIRIDEKSTKVLHLTMKDMSVIMGVWNAAHIFKMSISIPEINFHKEYADTDNAGSMDGMPGAIHLVTRQIIDDPAIQDYILCKSLSQ